jgi:hypothetical protein
LSCTDLISALNTVASYVTDPSILEDLSGDTAALSLSTTEQEVQLSGGGVAVLTIPPTALVDGQLFEIIVSGTANKDATSATPILHMYRGTDLSDGSKGQIINLALSVPPSSTANFSFKFDCIWSSATQSLGVVFQGYNGTSFHGLDASTRSASAQTDLVFFLAGSTTSTPSSETLTVTEFKAKLL